MGFFDQDPLTYFVRPRFQLNIEYFALVFEIAGLVSVLANCVFLIGKLRKAPTGFLLRGLLAISILISIFIFANILLLYVTFSLSTLTVTTWSLTAAQVLLISIETEAIKVFVPGLPEWIIYVLRGINTALAVALGLPQFFRGPIFTNPADPGVYTTWYSATNQAGYVGFYDFSFCVFIVYQIYVVGRKSMYNLHGATAVGMATSKAAAASKMDTSSVSVSASANGAAPPTASMTPGSPTSPTESAPVKNDFARIKAEFQAQVRDTIISLVLFFAFTVLGTACSKASTDYFAGVFTMENMLTGIAFSQIAVGSAGPHVAFISLMLYNVALLVRTSHGQSSKSRWRTRGKKSASSDRDDDNDEGSAPSKSMSRK